jgi:predicted nucleic acid-binding protein
MERPKYVLDSTVIINHLNNKFDIDAFFTAIPGYERFVSGITDIEALSKPGMTDAEIDQANAFLLKFVSIDLEPAIKEEAARIRRNTKMETPDAAIAATAVILGAICLSSDDHLQKLVWPGYTVQPV